MDWIFYYFLYILVRLLVVLRLSFCMRSQRLRAPSEPRQERDRSPKRNRAPTPIQTSSFQDHSKRQSLSCPPVRPPLPHLPTQPAPQVSARPPPIPPTPVPARRKVRPSGRALSPAREPPSPLPSNLPSLPASSLPSPYPFPLEAPEPHMRRRGTLNPDQVEASRSPRRYEALDIDHVELPQRSRCDARGIMTQSSKEEFITKVIELLRKDYEVTVEAVWSLPRDGLRQTVIGLVHMTHPKDPNSTELFAEWDGDKNTAYRFPHPEINYHSLELSHVRAQMPGGKPVEDLIPTFERVRITDPKGFSPYDPVTWQPWIDTDDLFKPRELIRELREAPQLGVRFNPPPQRERLFKMLTEWVYAACNTEGWLEKHNLAVALLIIEELRNHYWAAAGVAVERVQQRLHRDDDPQDRYGQLVVDEQLRGRTAQRAPRRRTQAPYCFACHHSGHFRSNCPQSSQHQGGQFRSQRTPAQDFRGGVVGGANRYGATRAFH